MSAPVQHRKGPILAFAARALFILTLTFSVALLGCNTPSMSTVTGAGMFHDMTQIRKGMSSNEVLAIMGSNYKNVMEPGIHGMDGGYYTWVYPECKVYFNYDGVMRVEEN